MGRLSFIILYLICCTSFVKAQQLSQGYSDSAKSFLAQWVGSQPDFVYNVLDNISDSGMVGFCMRQINARSLFDQPSVINKRLNSEFWTKGLPRNGRVSATDSIILTPEETALISEKLIYSNSFKWPKDFFPGAAIVDTATYYTTVWNERMRGVRQPAGMWVLSLPVFLRNGTYAVIYQLYYCGPNCGYDGLVLYKNEQGYWKKYGSLMEGQF